MNEATHELAERLEELLPKVMRALSRTGKSDPLAGQSVAQIRMLRLLFADQRRPSSVSEELGLSLSAVTQMANRLEAAGLVKRVGDRDDRRFRYLQMTKRGRQLMQRRRDQRVLRAAELLQKLPCARQRAVLEALGDLAGACECPSAGEPESKLLVADL
jgi:DNA-binding MarR family transcriptional regulator